MTVVAILLGFSAGWLFGWLGRQTERSVPQSTPEPRFCFRMVLRDGAGLPMTVAGEIVTASEAEAWDWVRRSIVVPGEWWCELWHGRPQVRVLIADLDEAGDMIVGQRADRQVAIGR